MRLAILHPEVAFRDCTDCEMYVYDEKTGERAMFGGNPIRRAGGNVSPCRHRAGGCPKGTPEESRALTERNWKAWEHYRECRAVGQFPDDAIVRRNASIIRAATDAAENEQRAKQFGALAVLMRGAG